MSHLQEKMKEFLNSDDQYPCTRYYPGLFFQRFLVVSRARQLHLKEMMRYELKAYTTSLFEDNHILRKDDESQLALAIDKHFNNGVSIETTPNAVPCMERYVIGGGYLIRNQKWKKGDNHCKIAKVYADFTIKHYGLATVVFVGYDAGPPIKNNTHKRNKQNMHELIVHFVSDVEFECQQEEFLSMESSKQRLIKSISEEMLTRSCIVLRAR